MSIKKIILFASIPLSIFILQSCWNVKFDYTPCPILTGLTPDGAPFDSTVTIKGSGFIKGKTHLYTVSIAGVTLPKENILDVPDENSLVFKVPKGARSGTLTVSVKDGAPDCQSTNSLAFTYYYTATRVGTDRKSVV